MSGAQTAPHSLLAGIVLLKSFFSWIVVGGSVILTVVELIVEVGLDSLADSLEVLHVNEVGLVHVKVILEVLKHVHVILSFFVLSNSWEREGLVV